MCHGSHNFNTNCLLAITNALSETLILLYTNINSINLNRCRNIMKPNKIYEIRCRVFQLTEFIVVVHVCNCSFIFHSENRDKSSYYGNNEHVVWVFVVLCISVCVRVSKVKQMITTDEIDHNPHSCLWQNDVWLYSICFP